MNKVSVGLHKISHDPLMGPDSMSGNHFSHLSLFINFFSCTGAWGQQSAHDAQRQPLQRVLGLKR